MALRFIHLSDIHFGQERGQDVYIHSDVREQVLEDVRDLRERLPDRNIDGIIVTGDLAFAGKPAEYEEAGTFLDRLTSCVGCKRTAVQVIPGNHDIDRQSISKASGLMLSEITTNGAAALDSFLENEDDREVLFGRLKHYRKFADAYACPVDLTGGIAGQKTFPIAPGRTLRFLGLNSALSCGTDDQEGKLILGAKQYVLPRARGEELIVLCHHPLNWFVDSDAALAYVRSRARVLMSGHEHNPSFTVRQVEDGCDLLLIAAGATTPPKATELYQYTYNLIEFSWTEEVDGLRVLLFPRVWSNEHTRFEEHRRLPGREQNPVVLGCPNFRRAKMERASTAQSTEPTSSTLTDSDTSTPAIAGGIDMDDDFALQQLRFFRDLTGAQRLLVLIKTGVLPADWDESLNQSAERRALEQMKGSKQIGLLKEAIDSELDNRNLGEARNG